jgi:Fe2+ transport system protein FeoA
MVVRELLGMLVKSRLLSNLLGLHLRLRSGTMTRRLAEMGATEHKPRPLRSQLANSTAHEQRLMLMGLKVIQIDNKLGVAHP